ncbi:MAG: pilus assembly PilX N-terminal domain-containing protein [Patescibacteria group bacterium]
MKIQNKYNPEKGVSIFLAIVVTATLLGIGVGITSILVEQMATLRSVGDSVLAFYAADGGIERVLRVDTCMLEEIEVERLDCIRATINNLGFDDPDCQGTPTPNNETQCRRDAVAAIPSPPVDRVLPNGATYELEIIPGGGSCPGLNYCAKSTGTYKQAVRKVEISR